MSALPTACVAVVVGEGGSGGALALGVADRVLMLENSVYSVISPEGCAAILCKDASQRERAAEALKLTPEDLLQLKLIDEIVPEPPGGAHQNPDATGEALREALIRLLTELRRLRPDRRAVEHRCSLRRRAAVRTSGAGRGAARRCGCGRPRS
jgi:acetyl-CoA carboxylase carboxyl transferase subunit alpha